MPSFIDSLKKRIGSRTVSWLTKNKFYSSGSLSGFLGIGSTAGKQMQLNRGWVYAAVNAIGEAVANIDFVLYRKAADGTNAEIDDHPLLDILDGVNPTMTGFELKMRIAMGLELTGNAYVLLMDAQGNPVKSETEAPAAMHPLIPSKVQVDRGTFPELVKAYKYTDRNNTIMYEPFQILHIKYPNPDDDVLGLSPVAALSSWIETEENASDFQRIFFLQGTKVGGVLQSSQPLTNETIELLRSQWHEMQQGLRNAHKPVILPDYVKYVENTRSTMELDFVNSLNEMRDKILAGLRVPKTLLGNAEGSTNRATAETATYVFALYTIKPKMQLITAYLNEFLVPRFGADVFLGFKDPVPENKDAELAELKTATAGQASMTINEAREKYYGLPAISGGDSIMAPITLAPLGEATTAPDDTGDDSTASFAPTRAAKDIKAKTKRVVKGKLIKTRAARNAENRRSLASSIAKLAIENAKKAAELPRKPLAEYTREEYAQVWDMKIARIAPLEKKLASVIKKANDRMEADAKRNLSQALKRAKAVDPAKLIDKKKFVKLIVEGATPVQAELYKQEATAAAVSIGVEDVTPLTPAALTALNASVDAMANSYTDTTLSLLKSKLEQGISDGLGLSDLADVVGGVFDYGDETSADMIARTETTRISNAAKVDAWQQTGLVKTKIWYTANDEMVCPFCEDMDGTEIDLGDNFFDSGDTVGGSDGSSMSNDYSDIGGPPLHPNCRCDLRPGAVSDDNSDDNSDE